MDDFSDKVFTNYWEFALQRDNRDMDAVCADSKDFKLQNHQKFLKEYVKTDFRNILLFHAVGSGKSCSTIGMMLEYNKKNPGNKVKLLLPARLKTNFFDELITPCALNKHISAADYATYHDIASTTATKTSIRAKFMASINESYEFYSFEAWKLDAQNSGDLKSYITQFTKNSLIVCDEVHNLLSTSYDQSEFDKLVDTDRVTTTRGFGSMLFKYMNLKAHKSCQMIYLTATPIHDNVSQLRELALVMSPHSRIDKDTTLRQMVDMLRGKVSYFPGTSVNAYPTSSYNIISLPLSITQDVVIKKIQDEGRADDDDDSEKEGFLSKQRQASIACLPRNAPIDDDAAVNRVLSNMHEYCPKIEACIDQIESDHNPGKHLIYCGFVAHGTMIIAEALIAAGWVNFTELNKGVKTIPYKVFATWDGKTKDVHKAAIKSIANSSDNVDGRFLKVIIGSPSIKEGVSFKAVQNLHLIDPVWNQASKIQVEGRAIRFCSHAEIPKTHLSLSRHVVIHIYKMVPRAKGHVQITSDMNIYDVIIPSKYEAIKQIEDALKRASIDFHLFKDLYNGDSLSSTLVDNMNVELRQEIEKKKTCPSRRRPRPNCEKGYTKKFNRHGDACCYKTR